jgi:hypothetical protein
VIFDDGIERREAKKKQDQLVESARVFVPGSRSSLSYKSVSRCCATPDKGWSGKILIVRNTNLENDERKLE